MSNAVTYPIYMTGIISLHMHYQTEFQIKYNFNGKQSIITDEYVVPIHKEFRGNISVSIDE